MTGFAFSEESTRLLLQLILEAGREEQAECITDNLHVECAYYPDAQKLVVINNSGEKQKQRLYVKEPFGACSLKDMKRGYRIYVGWETKGSNI